MLKLFKIIGTLVEYCFRIIACIGIAIIPSIGPGIIAVIVCDHYDANDEQTFFGAWVFFQIIQLALFALVCVLTGSY